MVRCAAGRAGTRASSAVGPDPGAARDRRCLCRRLAVRGVLGIGRRRRAVGMDLAGRARRPACRADGRPRAACAGGGAGGRRPSLGRRHRRRDGRAVGGGASACGATAVGRRRAALCRCHRAGAGGVAGRFRLRLPGRGLSFRRRLEHRCRGLFRRAGGGRTQADAGRQSEEDLVRARSAARSRRSQWRW